MACIAFQNKQKLPITVATQAIENIIGLSPEKLIERSSSIMDWIHPDDALAYMNELQDYIDQPEIENFEKNDFRIINHGQHVHWIREQGYLQRNDQGEVLSIFVSWHLVTEEYELKRTHKESIQNLNIMLDSLNVGFYEYFFGTDKVVYSDSWKQILGYQPHEIESLFSEWEKRTPSNYVESTLQALDEHLQGKTKWFEATFPMRHKAGHQIWILAKGKAQKNDQGYPYKLVGTFIDLSNITEAPLLQQAAKPDNIYHNSTFEQIFMQAPVGVVLLDLNGLIIDINPKFIDMLGYHPSEVKSHSMAQFLHPDDRQESYQNLEKLVKGDISVSSSTRKVFDKSGHLKYINLSTFVITTKEGKKILCATGTDNTIEAKKQEIEKHLDILIQSSQQSN